MVPELRFKGFEEELKPVVFDEITSITRLAGYEYSKYWKEDEEQEIIALRGYNIGKGSLVLRDLAYISNELSLKLIRSRLNVGDIVYPCVGSIGNAVVIEENDKYHIQQNIAKITCKESAYPHFVVQFLTSELGMKEVYRFNATSSQPNVLVGSLRQFKLRLPHLPEQKKIADFLSAVDARIQQLGRKKEGLEQYKKGVIQKLFSQQLRFKRPDGTNYPDWEEKRLGEVCKKKSSNVAANMLETNEGSFPVYGASGFIKGLDFYNEEDDYIAIVKDGAGVGRNFLCPKKSSVLGTLDILTSKEDNCVVFLYYFLQQFRFAKYVIGSTIPHIYFKDYSTAKLTVPNPEEQQKIADFLSALDKKIEAVSTQMAKTQLFKKGLLQKMFV